MAESPQDWTLLFTEVDEVRSLLLSKNVSTDVSGDVIISKLERRTKSSERVNDVVSEIISEMNSEQPDVVLLDGEDSSEVEVLYHAGNFNSNNANSLDPKGLLVDCTQAVRERKRQSNIFPHPETTKRPLNFMALENVQRKEEEVILMNSSNAEEISVFPPEVDIEPGEVVVGSQVKLTDQISHLLEIFPHGDPSFLRQAAINCGGNESKLSEFVAAALENRVVIPSGQNLIQLDENVPIEPLPSCSKSLPVPLHGKPNFTAQQKVIPGSSSIDDPSETYGQLVQNEAFETSVPGPSGESERNNVEQFVNDSVNVVQQNKVDESENDVDYETEKKDDMEKSALYSEQLEYLIGVLPDADPKFLEDKVYEFEGGAEKLKAFVAMALDRSEGKRIYPTRGESQKREEHEAQVRKFTNNFSVEDFLEVFPDPVAHFESNERVPNDKIRNHCLAYLKTRYKYSYACDLLKAFRRNNYNLSLTVKNIDEGQHAKRRTKRSANDCRWPAVQSIPFLQEMAYIENKKLIEDFIEAKARRRREAFEAAKARNELLTCNCCFEDELLSEDMSACNDGHLFCIPCIKKGSEVIIGDGKSSFPCMEGNCKAEFSLATLQGILSPPVFGKLVMRLQVEEINAAGIEGLETCPSCPYSTIPAPEDKVFKCLNPDCMKETCRNCKEPSHIPLKCEEVEKNDQIKARTYIEDKMTEALIRTCWKCNRKFIKESGCNKMTCTCGALMCYYCRKPVKDYKHFNPYNDRPSDLCPLYSDDATLHAESVRTEAQKAKEEVLRENPEVDLKYDPTLKLPEVPTSSKNQNFQPPFIGDDGLFFDLHALYHRVRENQPNIPARLLLLGHRAHPGPPGPFVPRHHVFPHPYQHPLRPAGYGRELVQRPPPAHRPAPAHGPHNAQRPPPPHPLVHHPVPCAIPEQLFFQGLLNNVAPPFNIPPFPEPNAAIGVNPHGQNHGNQPERNPTYPASHGNHAHYL